MAEKKLPVCPHCGSKNVQAVNDFYRCEDCLQDFGRDAESEEGIPLTEAIKGLRFRYGDIVSGSVRLRIVQEEDDCIFEVYDANEGGVDKVADVLDMNEWNKIKDKLVNAFYVSDWNREYIPVNDGQTVPENNEWELDLDINEDESLTFKGYDAYPVYWNAFMRVIHPFFERLQKA